MFNDLIEKWEARVQEAATTASSVARAYAERIIARLDAIQEAVTNAEFDNRIEVVALTVAASDPPAVIAAVPVGQTWELQYLASSTDAQLTFSDGQRFMGEIRPRPAANPKFTILGGSVLTVDASIDTVLYAQFRVSRPKPTKRTTHTGMVQLPQDGVNTVDENVGRHGPGDVTRHPIRPTGDAPNPS